MKALPSSKSISAWQTERQAKLQRACNRIRRAQAAGKPIGKTIRRVSHSLNGRPFRCDPARRLMLSAATLRRLWDNWRRGGEVPAAFKLNFYRQPSALTAPVLVRFTDFISAGYHRSLSAAWQKFCNRAGALGYGRRKADQRKITYDMLRHNFGVANFYRIQGALKSLQAAQNHLAKERWEITAAIRARLSNRPRRHRVKREIAFEI
jgi:hypothetical protein